MSVSSYTLPSLFSILTFPDTLTFFLVSLGGAFALNLLCNDIYNKMTNGPTWGTVVTFFIPSILQIAIVIVVSWLNVKSSASSAVAAQYLQYLVDCCTDDNDFEELKATMELWRSNDQSKSMTNLAPRMKDFKHSVRVSRLQSKKMTAYRWGHFVGFILQPFLILMATAPGTIVLNLISSYISDFLKYKEEWRTVLAFVVSLTVQIATGLVWWFSKLAMDQKMFQEFQSCITKCALKDYEQLKNYMDVRHRADTIGAIESIFDRASWGKNVGDLSARDYYCIDIDSPQRSERNGRKFSRDAGVREAKDHAVVLKRDHETISGSTLQRRKGLREAEDDIIVVERDLKTKSRSPLRTHEGSAMAWELEIKDDEGARIRPTIVYSSNGSTLEIKDAEGTRIRPTIICRDNGSTLTTSWLKNVYEKLKAANILPDICYIRNPVHPVQGPKLVPRDLNLACRPADLNFCNTCRPTYVRGKVCIYYSADDHSLYGKVLHTHNPIEGFTLVLTDFEHVKIDWHDIVEKILLSYFTFGRLTLVRHWETLISRDIKFSYG